MDNINLDERINWESFYAPYMGKVKHSNGNLIGQCPFHNDSKPSFSVSLTTGMYKCFSCGEEGNATTFLSKIKNIDQKEAYKELLEMAGIEPGQKEDKPKEIKPYTTLDYASDKGFSTEFLQDLKIKNGKKGISIPYMDTTGKFIRNRMRYGHNNPMRFSWGKGGDLCLYGLWKLDKIKKSKELILVEGESDTQTLWYLGVAALGVPGAATFKKEWTEHIKDIERLYLHKEPDLGGETFVNKVCAKLKEYGFKGEVYIFNLPSYKDPSDMYLKLDQDKKKCKNLIEEQMAHAVKVELAKVIDDVIECAPVKLKSLNNYRVDDTGVWQFIKDEWRCICRTPLVLSKRIRHLETGEEKIELAFKRDNKWHYIIDKRSVVFQSRNIINLSDHGITITSENAKFVIRYLQELEAANFEILDKAECVDRLGWHEDMFLPYGNDNLILDVESNARMWTNGYKVTGEFKNWRNFVNKFREKSPIIRAYIAAACATPFLKPLGQRIFYLYNWADTEGGKTACLTLALSVWGDPSKLMQTYNSTSVGLEFMAQYMNDLPLGLNERQAAGKDQGKLETDAYRLAEGKGRLRGNKKGGLQNRGEWRSIILANGEEPFITEGTMSGVSTRTIEIYGKPFEYDHEAKSVYEFTQKHYGSLGDTIVKKCLSKDKVHSSVKIIKQTQVIIENALRAQYKDKKSSNISAVAFICAVDVYISANFLNKDETQDSILEKAVNMADFILKQVEGKRETDVVEKFYKDTLDWFNVNRNKFILQGKESATPLGEIYGLVEFAGTDLYQYVYPKVFEDFCKKEGQSSRKMLQGFSERGYIKTCVETGSKLVTSVRKSILGKQARVIQFILENTLENSENDEKMPF